MAITIANHKIAQADIEYPTGTSLGSTIGPVVFKVEDQFAETKCEQYGDTPTKVYHVGTRVTVEFTLAEISTANYALALNQTNTTDTGIDYVTVDVPIGEELTENECTIKAYSGGIVSTAEADWIVLNSAVITGAVEVEYGATPQQGLKITMIGLPDASADIAVIGDDVV